jgi:hypothetical protein
LFLYASIPISIVFTIIYTQVSENQDATRGNPHNFIGGAMTSYVETLLVKHVKLSSIDEGKLRQRRVSLDDSLALLQSLSTEFESQSSQAKFLECVGVLTILTSLVSDIVRDTLGASLSKTNPLMKLGLDEIYDKARDDKWGGNRYEELIKSIDKNGGYLEALAKLDKSGATQMVVTVHKHMLMNIVALKGFTEDSQASRMVLANALRALQKNIKVLEAQRRQVQFYLDTGTGAAPAQNFTPIPPTQRLH